MRQMRRRQQGQGTIEYLGALVLVAAVLALGVAVAGRTLVPLISRDASALVDDVLSPGSPHAIAPAPTARAGFWPVGGGVVTTDIRSDPVAHAAFLSRPPGRYHLPSWVHPRPDWSYYFYSSAPFTKTDTAHQIPLSYDDWIIANALTGKNGARVTRDGDYVQYNMIGGFNSTQACLEIGGMIRRSHGVTSLEITHRFADPRYPTCEGLPNPGPGG